jgi:hypothetical protein
MKTYSYSFIFAISTILSFATTSAIAISATNGCDDEWKRCGIVTTVDESINYVGVWDSESSSKDILLIDKSAQANNALTPYTIWLTFEEGRPIWSSFGRISAETSNQTFLSTKFRHFGLRYQPPSASTVIQPTLPPQPYPVSSVLTTFRHHFLSVAEVSTNPLVTYRRALKRPLDGFKFATDANLSRGTALWVDGHTLSGIVFDYDDYGQPTWYLLNNCVGSDRYTCEIRNPREDGTASSPLPNLAIINMDSAENWRVELTFRYYEGDVFWIQQRLRVVTQLVSTTRLMSRRQ